MRGQPAPSRGGHRRGTGPSRGGAAGSGGDGLRVVRATRDQLGVEWSAEADPLSWQVVCWDSRDAAVARLQLTATHRRATFAGLARLQQPFTIAVSGLGADGSVLWQAGLADLYLRAGRPAGRAGVPERMRTSGQRRTASQGRERAGVTEAAKEGSGLRQDGQDEEAEAEEEDRAREVAAAGVDPGAESSVRRVGFTSSGRADRVGRFAGSSETSARLRHSNVGRFRIQSAPSPGTRAGGYQIPSRVALRTFQSWRGQTLGGVCCAATAGVGVLGVG